MVEQLATPTEVYERPSTSFVAGFIGKTNLLECKHRAGLRAGAGTMELSLAGEPAERDFTLSIRPEAIVVGEESRGLANHFEGKVADVLFLGHEREVIATVGDQRVMLRSGQRALSPGDTIEFGWNPDDAVIVKATGTWRQLQPEL